MNLLSHTLGMFLLYEVFAQNEPMPLQIRELAETVDDEFEDEREVECILVVKPPKRIMMPLHGVTSVEQLRKIVLCRVVTGAVVKPEIRFITYAGATLLLEVLEARKQ